MDAIVVAKSAFHHSINYRSVIIFASAEKIESPDGKMEAFEWLTNKIVPGSWNYLRTIQDNEISKTTVLSFPLSEASAKLRNGMPIDDEEDLDLPIWSGIIPLETVRKKPEPDLLSQNILLPAHLA
jgi:nitroimidazol reductase NimA-like FMN-containing flavoprotein (pyridoxamine 5'-phosphate oxidase superfamily)